MSILSTFAWNLLTASNFIINVYALAKISNLWHGNGFCFAVVDKSETGVTEKLTNLILSRIRTFYKKLHHLAWCISPSVRAYLGLYFSSYIYRARYITPYWIQEKENTATLLRANLPHPLTAKGAGAKILYLYGIHYALRACLQFPLLIKAEQLIWEHKHGVIRRRESATSEEAV